MSYMNLDALVARMHTLTDPVQRDRWLTGVVLQFSVELAQKSDASNDTDDLETDDDEADETPHAASASSDTVDSAVDAMADENAEDGASAEVAPPELDPRRIELMRRVREQIPTYEHNSKTCPCREAHDVRHTAAFNFSTCCGRPAKRDRWVGFSAPSDVARALYTAVRWKNADLLALMSRDLDAPVSLDAATRPAFSDVQHPLREIGDLRLVATYTQYESTFDVDVPRAARVVLGLERDPTRCGREYLQKIYDSAGTEYTAHAARIAIDVVRGPDLAGWMPQADGGWHLVGVRDDSFGNWHGMPDAEWIGTPFAERQLPYDGVHVRLYDFREAAGSMRIPADVVTALKIAEPERHEQILKDLVASHNPRMQIAAQRDLFLAMARMAAGKDAAKEASNWRFALENLAAQLMNGWIDVDGPEVAVFFSNAPAATRLARATTLITAMLKSLRSDRFMTIARLTLKAQTAQQDLQEVEGVHSGADAKPNGSAEPATRIAPSDLPL